jgi:hypothetical protein
VDPEQVKYFKLKDEVERLKARTSNLRNEGYELPTITDLKKKAKENPFAEEIMGSKARANENPFRGK